MFLGLSLRTHNLGDAACVIARNRPQSASAHAIVVSPVGAARKGFGLSPHQILETDAPLAVALPPWPYTFEIAHAWHEILRVTWRMLPGIADVILTTKGGLRLHTVTQHNVHGRSLFFGRRDI